MFVHPHRIRAYFAPPAPFAYRVLFAFSAVLGGYFLLDTFAHRTVLYLACIVGGPLLLTGRAWAFLTPDRLLVWSVTAYFAVNLLSLFWSGGASFEARLNVPKSIGLIVLFCFFLVFLLRRNMDYLDILILSFLVSSLLSGLLLLLWHQFAILGTLSSRAPFRLYGFGRAQNPNMAAFLYSVSFLFLHFYSPRTTRLRLSSALYSSFGKALASFLLLLLIFLTGSRNGLLSLSCTVSAMALFTHNRRLRLLLFVVLACLCVVAFAVPGLWETLLLRADAGRFDVWAQAIEYVRAAPFFGHGAASELAYHAHGVSLTSAHNIWLGHLNYTGVAGALCFGVLAVTALRKAFQYRNDFSYLPLSLLVFGGVWGLFSGHTYIQNLNPEWLVSWFPLALIVGMGGARIPHDYRSR